MKNRVNYYSNFISVVFTVIVICTSLFFDFGIILDDFLLQEERYPSFFDSFHHGIEKKVYLPVDEKGDLKKNLVIYPDIDKNVHGIHFISDKEGKIIVDGENNELRAFNTGKYRVLLPEGEYYFDDGGAYMNGVHFVIWCPKSNCIVADGNDKRKFSIVDANAPYEYLINVSPKCSFDKEEITPMVCLRQNDLTNYTQYVSSKEECLRILEYEVKKTEYETFDKQEIKIFSNFLHYCLCQYDGVSIRFEDHTGIVFNSNSPNGVYGKVNQLGLIEE